MVSAIQKVAEVLSDESKWTQGAGGRNAEGRELPSYDGECCCWCLDAALWRAWCSPLDHAYSRQKIESAIKVLFPARFDGVFPMIRFNDHPNTTFADVRRVLGYAAEHPHA